MLFYILNLYKISKLSPEMFLEDNDSTWGGEWMRVSIHERFSRSTQECYMQLLATYFGISWQN